MMQAPRIRSVSSPAPLDNMRVLLTCLVVDVVRARLVREFPVKACMECRFSNGGHQLAIAAGNLIMVYSTYTCELLGNLRSYSRPSFLVDYSGLRIIAKHMTVSQHRCIAVRVAACPASKAVFAARQHPHACIEAALPPKSYDHCY